VGPAPPVLGSVCPPEPPATFPPVPPEPLSGSLPPDAFVPPLEPPPEPSEMLPPLAVPPVPSEPPELGVPPCTRCWCTSVQLRRPIRIGRSAMDRG